MYAIAEIPREHKQIHFWILRPINYMAINFCSYMSSDCTEVLLAVPVGACSIAKCILYINACGLIDNKCTW